MKKLVLALFLSCAACLLYANEHVIFNGKGFAYNELMKGLIDTDYAIKYDDQKQVFYLFKANLLTASWIEFSNENLATLRANLQKYQEWEKAASAKGVELEKALPDSEIATKVVWKLGEDWHHADDLTVGFLFFSQSTKRHQLVIQTNNVSSSDNEFVSFSLDPIYLDKKQTSALLDAISEKSLKKALDKLKKQKADEAAFQ